MKNKILAFSLLALVAVPFVGGCDGAPAKEDKGEVQARVDKATQMRAIFDKVNGDYSKLTPDDKASFQKLNGSDEDGVKRIWMLMKYGLNAPAGASLNGPKP